MIESTNSVATSDIYKSFSKTNYSSNKAFLSNAYGFQTKPLYYNDPKKEKRRNIKIAAALGASALAIGAIVLGVITSGRSGKNMSKILDPKTIQQNAETFGGKLNNFMANINPVKDDVFDRVATSAKEKNIPVVKYLRNFCDATTNFYRNILKTFQKSTYENAANVLRKEGVEVANYDDWFNGLNSTILETLKGSKNQRITNNIFNKNLLKTMTEGNIADSVLEKNEKFRQIAGNITSDIELSKEGQEALKVLNRTRNTVTSKLRDINAGSAPTDFVTIIMSTLGLTAAMATSETKEEKKSIGVNLGIPLLTTLCCNSLIGNALGIAGARSLLFSLAAGQLASVTAKTIDKKLNKHNLQTEA